ncbi:hypothetical protein TIFTF001_024811 [Ficus carica]|uniref:BZIP domain-containing protein n=1 Tax=Ficus carica TaxID=3494 RepID=A0AA88AIM6_FICCA|nr:hypothetical protein TIFTF001_024811 [Ficus carica]
MASSTSSGSYTMVQQTSGSDQEDLQALMDQRKRKRMISNRESARRSRMRKQKHLDDMTAQVAQLRKENHQIMTRVSIATQHYMSLEAENSVLRAQVGELSHRLQSLDEIIAFLAANNGGCTGTTTHGAAGYYEPIESFLNPLSLSNLNQPIMASADVFQY